MDAPILHEFAFVKHLEELESEQVARLREEIAGLTDHPGWDSLLECVRLAEERALNWILNGATLDHAQYARAMGYVKGLRQIAEIPQAVHDKATTELRKVAQAADEALERS